MTTGTTPTNADDLREAVRDRYAGSALRVIQSSGGCCVPASTSSITRDLYGPGDVADVPADALLASLGCGNPTAVASLAAGETVLDLGSGGGIDVLLSARRVGPTGHAYGLDMTDEMLALAEQNRQSAGAENVSFLKGTIEAIPLPDRSVDVIISNCVINLSVDKPRVLAEAFRVLRPGGRFAVSDIVSQGTIPADLRADMTAWSACISGALEDGEYRELLAAAGFADVEVDVTRIHEPRQSDASGDGNSDGGTAYDRFAAAGGRMVSAVVRARKPE